MHYNLINSRVWWSSPIFFFFLIVQQNPALPPEEGPWKTGRCHNGVLFNQPGAAQKLPVWGCWCREGLAEPQLPADRSSFQRDGVSLLAQTCLLLSLFLKQPLVPFCSSCLQRRETNFFFSSSSSLIKSRLVFMYSCLLRSGAPQIMCLVSQRAFFHHSDPSPVWSRNVYTWRSNRFQILKSFPVILQLEVLQLGALLLQM